MPAAGLQPLRVGPEDVTVAEAGEMVAKVGVYNQAKGLIQAVAKQVPRELRIAAARYEHVERSKALVRSEVEAQTEKTVGEFSQVLSARVRGDKNNPLNSNVVVLYELPSGRTARCAIDYASSFPKSTKAFDQALADGTIGLGSAPDADPEVVRKQNERLQAEVARLTREAAEADTSVEEPEQEADANADNEGADGLEDATVPELRKLAKAEGIEGFSRAGKDALVVAIREHRASESPPEE